MGVCSDGRCATVVCQVMRDSGPVRHRGVDVSVGVLTYERPGLALVVLSGARAVVGRGPRGVGGRGGDRGGRAGWVHRWTVHCLGRAVPDGPPGRVGGPVAPAVVASAGGSCDRGRDGRNARGTSAGEMAGGSSSTAPPSPNVAESLPRSDGAGRRLPGTWSRYRGASTQNSWPSGSAMTTQLTSPWPMSMRVAPRETRRSTSAC
jgi:hypothetical protein